MIKYWRSWKRDWSPLTLCSYMAKCREFVFTKGKLFPTDQVKIIPPFQALSNAFTAFYQFISAHSLALRGLSPDNENACQDWNRAPSYHRRYRKGIDCHWMHEISRGLDCWVLLNRSHRPACRAWPLPKVQARAISLRDSAKARLDIKEIACAIK